MRHLVFNSTSRHLYKKNRHLVRTPIKVTLTADNFAYYVVAGEYTAQNLPDKGFIKQATYENCKEVGYDCIQAYLNPRPLQIWRQTKNIWPIPTTWYQGAYATSAPSMSGAAASCEACIWLGAIHFTLPAGVVGLLEVTEASIYATQFGSIKCWFSAGAGNKENTIWNDEQAVFNLVATDSLSSPSQMIRNTDQYFVLNATGTPRASFDLWKYSGTNRDGGIPKLVTPVTKKINLTDFGKNILTSSGGVWLAFVFDAYVYSIDNYRPFYISPTPGDWVCVSAHLNTKLDVTLGD